MNALNYVTKTIVQNTDGMSMHLPGSFAGHMVPGSLLSHATMYTAFALAGIVDLAQTRGRVPPAATHVALCLACWAGGFLFLPHPNHGAMPTAMHHLIVLVFWALGVAVALEGLGVPRAVMLWFRTGLLLLLATWFVHVSFSLYVVALPTDGTGAERSFISFVWHVLTISAALFGLRALKPWGRGNQL